MAFPPLVMKKGKENEKRVIYSAIVAVSVTLRRLKVTPLSLFHAMPLLT